MCLGITFPEHSPVPKCCYLLILNSGPGRLHCYYGDRASVNRNIYITKVGNEGNCVTGVAITLSWICTKPRSSCLESRSCIPSLNL